MILILYHTSPTMIHYAVPTYTSPAMMHYAVPTPHPSWYILLFVRNFLSTLVSKEGKKGLVARPFFKWLVEPEAEKKKKTLHGLSDEFFLHFLVVTGFSLIFALANTTASLEHIPRRHNLDMIKHDSYTWVDQIMTSDYLNCLILCLSTNTAVVCYTAKNI